MDFRGIILICKFYCILSQSLAYESHLMISSVKLSEMGFFPVRSFLSLENFLFVRVITLVALKTVALHCLQNLCSITSIHILYGMVVLPLL